MSVASRPTSRPKIWLASSRNGRLKPGTPNVDGLSGSGDGLSFSFGLLPSSTLPTSSVNPVPPLNDASCLMSDPASVGETDVPAFAASTVKDPTSRVPPTSVPRGIGARPEPSGMPLTNVMNAASASISERSAPDASSSTESIVICGPPTSSDRSLTTGIGAVITSTIGWRGPVIFLISLVTGSRNLSSTSPRSRWRLSNETVGVSIETVVRSSNVLAVGSCSNSPISQLSERCR